MAEWRKVHTRFWRDPEVLDMTPEDKLFYLYLLTNPNTTACGCYELPPKLAAAEMGYSIDTVNQLIERFIKYKKILYDPETREVLILNWLHYNPPSQRGWAQKIYRRDVEAVRSKTFQEAIERSGSGEVEVPSSSNSEVTTELLRSNYGVTTEQLRSNSVVTTEQLGSNSPIEVEVEVEVEVDKPSRSARDARAEEVLQYLNERAGKRFRQIPANHKHIKGRLREGATVEQLKLVTDYQVAQWLHDDKMRQYLRPSTLYSSEHWDEYLMAAQEWNAKGRPSNGAGQTDWRAERIEELRKQVRRIDGELLVLDKRLEVGGDETDMARHDELIALREKLVAEGQKLVGKYKAGAQAT
jgi:uncharacterized phage protein (TIGR02220 family)